MTNKTSRNPEFTIAELADRIGGRVIGNGKVKIKKIAPISDAGPGAITFIANPRYKSYLLSTRASALITSKEEPVFKGTTILVDNPYVAFAMILEIFNPPMRAEPGIHPNAVIETDTRIGEGVSIQANAVICQGVEIGRDACVMAGAYIGRDTIIGDSSLIYPNVTIYPRARIGKGVIIHAGSVIGSDGFGYAQKDGLPYKIPQVGRVVIEDDCEIGANVTIDRGTIGDTVIGKGTKIDNLVQIGHNVEIGPYSIIVSQVGISGSTRIGKGVVLAGQVGVNGHITIGDGAVVAAKAGVTKDVPPGETIGGFMGMPIAKWRRAEAVYRNLPDLKRGYKEIQKKIKLLKEKSKN